MAERKERRKLGCHTQLLKRPEATGLLVVAVIQTESPSVSTSEQTPQWKNRARREGEGSAEIKMLGDGRFKSIMCGRL